MRRSFAYAAAAALLLGGPAGLRAAAAQHDSMHAGHDAAPAAATPAPAAKTAAGGGSAATSAATPTAALRAALTLQLNSAEKQLLSLAEAMPADKYGWRPAEGVRSVGEVYMHVAAGNYFLPTFWGVKPAAGVDPRGFEKEGGDKAKTIATLKQSFDHLRQAIDRLSDADLTKPINFFGQETTVSFAVLQAVVHDHEHLGQEIAYARSNSVVPPWSAAQAPRGN
jgi:uncharacterized damage-inducible protein DinB